MKEVVNPFLKAADRTSPSSATACRARPTDSQKLYQSVDHAPTRPNASRARRSLTPSWRASTKGQPVPEKLRCHRTRRPSITSLFRGSMRPRSSATRAFGICRYRWQLHQRQRRGIAFYDGDGYPVLRDYLKKQGVRHVLLAGYSTDMCVCSTTAGYKNLSKDFNVFLVGDATLATFPAHDTPRFATSAAVSFASIDLFITQASWVKWK